MSGTGRTLIGSASTLNVTTGNVTLSARTISNSGVVNWSAGTINGDSGAAINNAGAILASFDGSMSPVVNNFGVVRKTGGVLNLGQTSFGAFNNNGHLIAETGAIGINNGIHSGAFTANAGTRITLGGGTHTLNHGTAFNGAGTARLTGAITIPAGAIVSAENVELSVLTNDGDFRVRNLMLPGANIDGAGTVSILPGGTMTISSTLLLGPGTLSNSGTANWNNERIHSSRGIINNTGVFNINVDDIWFHDFDHNSEPRTSFNNTGILAKNGGTASATLEGVIVNNSGTVVANSGTLVLSGGSGDVSSGNFHAATGAKIQFGFGTHILNAGATLTGQGTFTVTVGTLMLTTNIHVNNLEAGGSITGSGDLLPSNMSWRGALSGAGRLLISPTAVLNIPVGTPVLSRTLSNSGTANLNGANLGFAPNAVLNNTGTFNIAADSQIISSLSPNEKFNNFGVLTKSGGTGVTSIDVEFNNSGTVTVNVGTLHFRGGGMNDGSFTVAPGAAVQFGFAPRVTSINAPFNIAGAARALGGTVIANASFAASAIEIGASALGPARLVLSQSASPGQKLLKTQSLAFSGTARLDLNNNDAIIDHGGASPIISIRAALFSGYAGGAWNGTGIISTTALSQPNRALGYGEAAEVFGISGTNTAVFSGQSVDATSLLIRYTVRGDTNLDGQVGFADLLTVAANFGASNTFWNRGDFDYDANVGFSDLLAVAANFGAALPSAIPGASDQFNAALAEISVPEPALGALGLLTLIGRNRRRRREFACDSGPGAILC